MAEVSQTVVQLGYVPVNRGEYISSPETRYYKDNVVQYNGSSYIADPVGYDPRFNPLAYVTSAPYNSTPSSLNPGWRVFASGNNTFTTGQSVDSLAIDSTPMDESPNLVISGGVAGAIEEAANTKVDKEEGKELIPSQYIQEVENPEYVRVYTDSEDKILFGVKQDGEFYFGAGCPPQVKSYIEEKISALSLDEYESIVAFLDGLIGSDTTLKMMLDSLEENKVDKEKGKSLIDSEHADAASHIESPEYLQVTTDSEDKVLEGIQQDGTKVVGGDLNVGGSASINGDIRVLGNMELQGVSYKVIENPEYLAAWVDASDKVIFGLKTDGKTYVGDADFLNDIKNNQEAINEIKSTLASIGSTIEPLDIDALSSITTVENPEYIEAKTDSEGKLLAGRTPDGAAFENVGFSSPKVSTESVNIDGHIVENIEDPEGRSEVTTDSEGKILSYRDSEGVMHENVGIETSKLTLTDDGLDDLGRTLKAGGYGNVMDWSDEKFVEIPIPRTCAIINFGVDSQATSKSDRPDYQEGVNGDIPTTIEFWDKDGNYFKKPILLSAQGSSSMSMPIKNQAFDLDDGSKLKFGDWCAFDSFHIKKYYIDIFRGQCIVGYWLTEDVYQTRDIGNIRPWDYLNENNSLINGLGKFNKDFDTGALAHPDGFPVQVFFNGQSWGVYAFNMKKDRANYYCKKDNSNNIILDGALGEESLWMGTIDWTEFEIRNPKGLKDINGKKYNGDFPTELSDTDPFSKAVKDNIVRISNAMSSIDANPSKALFEEYFIPDFFMDYCLVSQVLCNFDGFNKNWIWCTWDGNRWAPTSYDMDSIFGMHWQGCYILPNAVNWILGGGNVPSKYFLEGNLYWEDTKARYAELRDKGVFTTRHIVNLLNEWLKKCGYDNLKNDIELYSPETPSYRKDLTNKTYWTFIGHIGQVSSLNPTPYDETKTDYAAGDYVSYYNYVYEAKSAMPAGTTPSGLYSEYPNVGGFYNSVQRVKNWLDVRFNVLDSYYVYNQN